MFGFSINKPKHANTRSTLAAQPVAAADRLRRPLSFDVETVPKPQASTDCRVGNHRGRRPLRSKRFFCGIGGLNIQGLMKLLSRILAVALAGLYGLFALSFLGVGLLAIASALLDQATEHTAMPGQLAAAAIFVAIASILFAAALGLFKEKRWARWPFLAVALLASVAAIKAVPVAIAILDHFHHPPEGAYVVLSKSDVASNLERFVLPSLWLFLFTAAAAIFVFHRTR